MFFHFLERRLYMSNEYNENSITVLEGLEAVRKRPGMYIGSTGIKGLNHLTYEITDNSVDEHLAGYCNEITVILNEDGSATITDNGRGIPIGIHPKMKIPTVDVVFTVLHAGGKFGNGGYPISGGLHGVGASVVNALSKWLEVNININGYSYYRRYEYGKPVGELKRKNKINKNITGTSVTFLPDDSIFEITKFKSEFIKLRLHETAYLNPDLTILFKDLRNNHEEEITYHEPNGIKAYIEKLNLGKETISNIIYFNKKLNNIEVECAVQYTNEFEESVIGFCNNICTQEGGTHITGFKTSFTTLINQYARELGVLKEKQDNYTGADVRTGMTAIIAIKHPEPRFEGQTKTKLDNPDAGTNTAAVTKDCLQLYFDRNLDDLKNIISCAEKSAGLRRSNEKNKGIMLTKNKFLVDNNGKLANCISKKPDECEIFIVEGDSAGGSAKTARNRRTQAILPLRGKILNVEKASYDKVLSNAEIRTMIDALGCGFSEGFGNDFDITKLRFNKIIIMTDADIDGSHIDTLLLTFFYRFMPDLIKNGHIYLASPPLYKAEIRNGTKNNIQYLYDDESLIQYKKTHKEGTFTLQRYKGLGEMDAEQLWETTLNPETRLLRRITIDNIAECSFITSVLMGTNVDARKDFIYKNADTADVDI